MQAIRTYNDVIVQWLEYSGRWSQPEQLHCEHCKVIDNGDTQIKIVFPEGDTMRKNKTAVGLKLNFKKATEFLNSTKPAEQILGREI